MTQHSSPPIDLRSPLSLRTSFMFPLQSPIARREVLIGALWLLVPGVGWLLNMGHRIAIARRMQQGLPPFPAWSDYPTLLRDGCITFLGMVEYHAPAVLLYAAAHYYTMPRLTWVAAILWTLATIAVPGYMTHYCKTHDPQEVFNPLRALRRVFQGGKAYWKAWSIALLALALSFTGLLAFGFGFLVTSVWFWQVAGFSFATVFTKEFRLASRSA